ncbi:MAG: alpha/beta hydrolase-fold protein [Ignavibacteriaceae bacterium]
MKYLLLFLFAFALSAFPQGVTITITVTAPNLSADEKIFISGNHASLGNWNPGQVSLEKLNDSVWSKEFSFPSGTKLEFKFTKGSWNSEALNEDKSVPGNYSFTGTEDATLNFTINYWKSDFRDPGAPPDFSGKVTGEVVYHRQMTYADILPRDVVVWLPPGYHENTLKRYPVLYMHDGQNLFDPSSASFGVDWQLDETSDSLIKNGIINDIIIVGIYCTQERMLEYVNTLQGHYYMNFIVNSLKPFIDSTYRTLSDRENTATGGSSAGGLISFMLVWEYNSVFSKAACLSPAFKIGTIDYVLPVSNYMGRKDFLLYIDNGGIGLEADLQPGIDDMISLLREKGYNEGKDFEYFIDAGAEHNEVAWAKRSWRFLELFYKK